MTGSRFAHRRLRCRSAKNRGSGGGANGEVTSLGTIASQPEAVRKLLKKLGKPEQSRVCHEVGPNDLFTDPFLTFPARTGTGGTARELWAT